MQNKLTFWKIIILIILSLFVLAWMFWTLCWWFFSIVFLLDWWSWWYGFEVISYWSLWVGLVLLFLWYFWVRYFAWKYRKGKISKKLSFLLMLPVVLIWIWVSWFAWFIIIFLDTWLRYIDIYYLMPVLVWWLFIFLWFNRFKYLMNKDINELKMVEKDEVKIKETNNEL